MHRFLSQTPHPLPLPLSQIPLGPPVPALFFICGPCRTNDTDVVGGDSTPSLASRHGVSNLFFSHCLVQLFFYPHPKAHRGARETGESKGEMESVGQGRKRIIRGMWTLSIEYNIIYLWHLNKQTAQTCWCQSGCLIQVLPLGWRHDNGEPCFTCKWRETSPHEKMRLSVLLFWLICLCMWAKTSGECKCHCTCSPEEQQLQEAQKSKRSESKGRIGHRLGHERPSRRDRNHRRKGKVQLLLTHLSSLILPWS